MTLRPRPDLSSLHGVDITGSRILVIDDEEANLELLRGLLMREGYVDVHCVADASLATSAFIELMPDIVLLDLMMPAVDGYAVLDSLGRVTPPDDMVPIIVLTADASVGARRRALALGARDFVSKPFDLVEVALRIANLLEMRMLYRRLQAQVAAT